MGKKNKDDKTKNSNVSKNTTNASNMIFDTHTNVHSPTADNSIPQHCEVTEIIVHSRVPVVTIAINEYEGLKREIIDKTEIIRSLNHNADMLRAEIQKNSVVIKELESTNNEYRIKINDLTDKNDQLTKNIEVLEKRIDMLNLEIENQKKSNLIISQEIKSQEHMNSILMRKIQQLEDRNGDHDDKEFLKKISIAIQDYNSRYLIETKIKQIDINKTLVRLKTNRISYCHYCDQSFSDEEIRGRFYVLGEQISNMQPYMKKIFENKYPISLAEIKDLLDQEQFSKPCDEILDSANNWWYD